MIISTIRLAALVFAVPAYASTYYANVEPILIRSCVSCHSPNGAAPMTLTSYETVRPWAKSIREQVAARQMPPFGADGPRGFFSNDVRLTDAEISTILQWIDAGCPEGNKTESNALTKSTGFTELGPPDVVARALTADAISADAVDSWVFTFFDFTAPVDLWIRGIRVVPETAGLAHHVNVFIVAPEYLIPPEQKILGNAHIEGERLLALWAPGRAPRWCPDRTAILLPKGARLGANIHYAPSETAQVHRLSLDLYLAEGAVDYALELHGGQITFGKIWIPPHTRDFTISDTRLLSNQELRVYGFAGHMHYRGTAISGTLNLPDGTKKTPFHIPRFNFDWQQTYDLTEPLTIPGGATITVDGTFDNPTDSPIVGGFRTEDEMAQIYLEAALTEQRLDLFVVRGVAK